jgi:ubiquinone/menaquinone biosynthesis C-methylase UbiE
VPEFDQLAELYDETRGGEERGDDFAQLVAPHLDGPDDSSVFEVGVGTGVVALGLARRGRSVFGLDVSWPMLRRGRKRLGPVVILGDAMELPIADNSISNAVSVWVVQAVPDPTRLFVEMARVLRPGGTYVVCTTQRPADDDAIGHIIERMVQAVDTRRPGRRPRGVTVDQIVEWSGRAGFCGDVVPNVRSFVSSPELELDAIERRAWPALRELDEPGVAAVTRPAVDALRALPPGPTERRGIVDVIVLRHGATTRGPGGLLAHPGGDEGRASLR